MTSHTDSEVLDETQLAWVVERAARAPSINNSQPWRFGWDGEQISLTADLQRGLSFSDPDGRELVISCGAALYNLRLALRNLGRSSSTTTFPDAHQPRLLAQVHVEPGPPATDTERAMLAAINRRHTHRGAFADARIRPELAVRLQQAAQLQGTQLVFVHDPGPQRQVLHLARAAERARSEDERARAETEAWTPPSGSARRDGVPAWSYGAGRPAAGHEELAARDFDLDRGIGSGEEPEQPTDGIAALVTDGDLAPDWLRAGLGLEGVLLTAAVEWSFAILHSRVTEVAGLRAELRRALGISGHPQLLLRFGYAGSAPATPRRTAAEIIDLPD